MLTSRQSVCLETLRYFISLQGRNPSYSELSAMLGIGKSASYRLVSQLIERGYVRRIPGAKTYAIHPSREGVFETFTFDDASRTLQPAGLHHIVELPADPDCNGYYAGGEKAAAILK